MTNTEKIWVQKEVLKSYSKEKPMHEKVDSIKAVGGCIILINN